MASILLKLSESTNAKVFSGNGLIHSSEFKKVKDWIDAKISNSTSKTDVRLHETITILGSRGSGKTTFLYNVLDHYTKKEKVEVIDIIDPTLIEEKGHVFLTIISLIADCVENKLRKSDCDPDSSSYLKKKEWREKLKSLAAGIPSMDGVGGNYDSWQDPEFIMDRGLRSVRSAKSLETDFKKLVKLSLEIIEKDAFIIALDDIDIDFRKGWPVLEVIRKYLTSPQIVTILSGDLKLFSKAIRKQQWKNFGKALLKNEGEQLKKMNEYNDLVTEMEGQYLQKVMQPQRRVHLTTIQEKINIYGIDKLEIFINEEKDENRIDCYYNGLLAEFGVLNSYQAEAYRSFLLSLPIRTQIQFLLNLEESKSLAKQTSAAFGEPESAKNQESIVVPNLTDAFLSDLYEKQVDIELAKSNDKYLNSVILKLLLAEKVLDEAYQIQPTTTDVSLNSSLLSLSLLFSQKVKKNPCLVFDYFIKIGYVRNLLSVLGYKNSEKSSSLEPSIEGLCKHSAIFQDRAFRDICCYMTSYIRAFLNTEPDSKTSKAKNNTENWGGTIALPGFAFIAKKGEDESSKKIDTIFKNESVFNQQVAYIPLSVSQPNYKQQSLPTYSIYVLLGAIAEIIRQDVEIKDTFGLEKSVALLAQVRAYPMPNFVNLSTIESEYQDSFKTKEGGVSENSLSKLMSKWIKRYPNRNVSPYLLGKISTRMFYAFRTLEQREDFTNLGEAMHARIIILLNSVLLEDVRENIKNIEDVKALKESQLSNNNPVDKNDVFIYNLKKVNDYSAVGKEKIQFSRWILSCPLFLLYLNREGLESLVDYISPIDYSYNDFSVKAVLDLSIFKCLKVVGLTPPKKKVIVNSIIKIPFSYGKKKDKFEATIGKLKNLYLTPDIFNGKSYEEISRDCENIFYDVSTYKVKRIKNIYKDKESWSPIP